jgi:hypothetical protein
LAQDGKPPCGLCIPTNTLEQGCFSDPRWQVAWECLLCLPQKFPRFTNSPCITARVP